MSYKRQRESAAFDLAVAIEELIDDRDGARTLAAEMLADAIVKFMERWERAK